MKLIVTKGATSVSVNVFIRDNSVSTGVGLTGLAFNTASLTAYYSRQNAAATAITLATQTATGAYSSGGFVAVDGTNMPGLYRLDIPDAVLASGVNSAYIMLKGATNMEPCVIEIELSALNLQDGVRAGLTALPNAAADAAGGLPISDAGGLNMDGLATAAALATVDGIVDNLISGIIFGAAATGTLSTTQATSNLTGYANDQFIGRPVIWLTGACEGEASTITGYASASGLLTFDALTTAPGNGDTFKIV